MSRVLSQRETERKGKESKGLKDAFVGARVKVWSKRKTCEQSQKCIRIKTEAYARPHGSQGRFPRVHFGHGNLKGEFKFPKQRRN